MGGRWLRRVFAVFAAVEGMMDDQPPVRPVRPEHGLSGGPAHAVPAVSVVLDKVAVRAHVDRDAHRVSPHPSWTYP